MSSQSDKVQEIVSALASGEAPFRIAEKHAVRLDTIETIGREHSAEIEALKPPVQPVPTDSPTEVPRVRYPLERGWTRRKLIRELAQMEKSRVQLADEYGVSQSAITQFAQRHETEIDEVKRDIENEFAGLWIAQKVARIAEYQADVDRIGDSTDPEMLRVKHAVFKAVADELGQIPVKASVAVNQTITYRIEGVDLSTLR